MRARFNRETRRFFIQGMLATAAFSLLPACKRGAEAGPGDKALVAVSIFPLYDLVKRIAGDALSVALVLPAGRSEHSYDPTPGEMARIAKAKLAISVGLGMDGWLEKIVKSAAGAEVPILQLGSKANPRKMTAEEVGAEAAEEAVHEQEEKKEQEAEKDKDHDHDQDHDHAKEGEAKGHKPTRELDTEDEKKAAEPEKHDRNATRTGPMLELRNVDVTFGRNPVLSDINLTAHPGQMIALVGPTGAGKTTIVNLLSRFYDVDAGKITLDGLDIRDVQQASIREQLGIVLQDTFLFSGTVMENIRYGRLGATDEEVIAAATLANADWFIRRLPQGYQTLVSEQGHNFSQGQRQLLAIARAVLADPRILILDEATSSVDTRTEMHIQEALLRLMAGRTAFVIAHRLSTIRQADQVLVINDGRIIERGTHSSLLEAKGFYHQLYQSQFRHFLTAEHE